MSEQVLDYHEPTPPEPIRVPRAFVVGASLAGLLAFSLGSWTWLATARYQRVQGSEVVNVGPNGARFESWGCRVQEDIGVVALPVVGLATIAALVRRREFFWAFFVRPLIAMVVSVLGCVLFSISNSAYP